MDTHAEIYEFMQSHAAAFSGIRDINSAVNAFHREPSRWEREKQWALTKERQAKKSVDDRAAPSSSSPLTTQITETIRRMKAMHASGATVEEIAEMVPCWVDDSGWSEESIGIILGLRAPRSMSFMKRMS